MQIQVRTMTFMKNFLHFNYQFLLGKRVSRIKESIAISCDNNNPLF